MDIGQAIKTALAHLQAGRLEQAEQIINPMLAARPDFPLALELAARLARRQGRHDQSLSLFERLLKVTGPSAGLLLEIGRSHGALNASEQALDYCGQALELEPSMVAAHHFAGMVLGRIGRWSQAARAFESAITHDPGHLPSHVNLCLVLEQANQASRAREAVETALARWPEHGELNLILAKLLRREGRAQEGLARLAVLDLAGMDSARQARLHYEMGICADSENMADEAWEHFCRANRLAEAAAPPQVLAAGASQDEIKALAKQFSRGWVESFSEPISDSRAFGPDPVFLVGFPRSGTTLLDQILDSHPLVTTMEERPFSAELVKLVGATERGFPLGLADLSAEQINQGRELYWRLATQTFRLPKGNLVVDKLPLNTIAVGVLWRFFPNAKFVLALRHPLDACLSCFMQNFVLEPLMVSFLDIGRTAGLYERVMNLWLRYEEVLPLSSHTIRYEDVVGDFDATVAALLGFLGLDWDDRVRDFHTQAAAKDRINTPSYHQVTRPIYTQARFRWQRYQTHLAPIAERLAPFIERFGYDQTQG